MSIPTVNQYWTECVSQEGHTYYYNSITNESSWELPASDNLDGSKQAQQKESLPPGWVSFELEDGQKYYYNEIIQVSSWDKPKWPTRNTSIDKAVQKISTSLNSIEGLISDSMEHIQGEDGENQLNEQTAEPGEESTTTTENESSSSSDDESISSRDTSEKESGAEEIRRNASEEDLSNFRDMNKNANEEDTKDSINMQSKSLDLTENSKEVNNKDTTLQRSSSAEQLSEGEDVAKMRIESLRRRKNTNEENKLKRNTISSYAKMRTEKFSGSLDDLFDSKHLPPKKPLPTPPKNRLAPPTPKKPLPALPPLSSKSAADLMVSSFNAAHLNRTFSSPKMRSRIDSSNFGQSLDFNAKKLDKLKKKAKKEKQEKKEKKKKKKEKKEKKE